jgi:AraC-like DNA-binding protein
MYFNAKNNERIFIGTITPKMEYMFKEDLKTNLSIIWNIGSRASFSIDKQEIRVEKNCVIFLTEFHKIHKSTFEKLNIIQFNRDFHCVENHDADIGCKGLLFFGASSIPQINIIKSEMAKYLLIWDMFMMELEEKDDYTLEMLRSLLNRVLILFVRNYLNENFDTKTKVADITLIREYNFLVEKNYKQLTQVRDYARLLHRSPKTLSNTFSKSIDKTPLQIINERRLLEAKRQLLYTDEPINLIADDLSFADVQAFSHFFRKNTNQTPSEFRKN